MSQQSDPEAWARFRFSIIGHLLAAPPPRGELHCAITELSHKHWTHPVEGHVVQFAYSTIERWYLEARKDKDPVGKLRRKRRIDAGQSRSLSPALSAEIDSSYALHPNWTVQLHYDNLQARVVQQPALGPVPSYATVRRYFRAQGHRRKRLPKRNTPGAIAATERLEHLEVRSYEMAHVNALWHTDFHHGSRRVMLDDGRWITPILFGAIDDHSRVICHLQWYTDETAQSFVHGLSQAMQKRGLPRAIMCDNGAAMKSEEYTSGLHHLSIVSEHILPYSPYQNGKKECFWGSVEGRLMALLESVNELTLDQLNYLTQVWVEQDYHHKHHSDIATTPIQRLMHSPDVSRPCPDSITLRRSFCRTITRTVRQSDLTVSVDGTRFEIPNQYRHLQKARLRYAAWDLSEVLLLDPNEPTVLCALYPLDKNANAQGRRRALSSSSEQTDQQDTTTVEAADNELPALFKKMIADYSATGLPTAYIPLLTATTDEEG